MLSSVKVTLWKRCNSSLSVDSLSSIWICFCNSVDTKDDDVDADDNGDDADDDDDDGISHALLDSFPCKSILYSWITDSKTLCLVFPKYEKNE